MNSESKIGKKIRTNEELFEAEKIKNKKLN